MKRHLGPNLGRGGGLESTKRKEESSSWLARGKASRSREKSKGVSEELAPGFPEEGRLDGLAFEEEKERVKSAIRPSFSEREKGAKGTWRGRLVAMVESGGPQPSGLNGTAPTSKTPTIVEGSLDFGCNRERES